MLELKLSQNRKRVKCGKRSVLFVSAEISPDDKTKMITPRCHICLVIDCSGSMYGDKIEDAKTAAIDVVRSLSPNDLVSIVTFSGVAEVKLNPTPASDNNIENVIRSIDVDSTTALHAGISKGFELLQHASAPNMVNHLDVFTDGVPNVPAEHMLDDQRDNDFTQLSREIRNHGMTLNSFGIGDDYDEHLTLLLAEVGGGKWQHVANTSELTTIVNEQVTEMKNTVISNPQLQLTLMDSAELATAAITKPTLEEIDTNDLSRTGRTLSIGLKNIIKDESQIIAMRITVPPIDSKEEIPLLTVEITEGNNVIAKETIGISCTDDMDLANYEDNPNPRVLLSNSEATVLLRKGLDGDQEAKDKATIILKNLSETDTDLLDDDTKATVIKTKIISGEIKPGMSSSDKKRVLHESTVIGDKKDLVCPNCNSPIRPTSKICGKCGKPINKNREEN